MLWGEDMLMSRGDLYAFDARLICINTFPKHEPMIFA